MTDHSERGNKRRGEKNGQAKLTADDVRAIRRDYTFNGNCHPKHQPENGASNLAKKYGVHKRTILGIVNYETWQHLADD